MFKDLMEQWFFKEIRFGDCDFLMVELMKTLIIEEKYSNEVKIDTLFWLRYVLWQDELLSNISNEYGEI
jgi:hypothetical protein